MCLASLNALCYAAIQFAKWSLSAACKVIKEMRKTKKVHGAVNTVADCRA